MTHPTRWRRVAPAGILFLALVALHCGQTPTVSDTGYVGTWKREVGNQENTIFIERAGDGYRFRLSVTSTDESREVRCDDNGECEETIYGQTGYRYRFAETRVDPDSGHLLLEYDVSGGEPVPDTVHYVEEVIVEPGGTTLRVHTVVRDAAVFEVGGGPTRVYQKVSDEVRIPS